MWLGASCASWKRTHRESWSSYSENPTWLRITCPGECARILSRKKIAAKELLILQNIDAIYWKLQEQGFDGTSAVSLQEGRYCVFNATPIEKYESFRQYLHKCVEEESSGDLTLLGQTLMEVMMDFLAMKKNDSFVSHMPFPELDSALIDRFQLGAAAEEFARYIHQACRGELDKRTQRAANDQFFVAVIESGLGYFCSKLLDPSRDGIEALAERVLNQIDCNVQLTRAITQLVDPARRPRAQHFAALRSAIEAKAAQTKDNEVAHPIARLCSGKKAVPCLPAIPNFPKRNSGALS